MKKKYLILVSICLLVVATCIHTAVTFSKFVKESNQSSNASIVAIPIVQFSSLNKDDTQYDLSLEEIDPTTTSLSPIIYSFDVSNYLLTQVSETAQKYTITISTTNNLPITITLKNTTQTLFVLNSENSSQTTSEYALNPNAQQKDDYTLEIYWNNDSSSSIYSGVVDLISILVNWEQID